MAIAKSTVSRQTLVDEFLSHQLYERGGSPHTAANYRFDLAKLDRFLPVGIDWPAVTRGDLRAFLQTLHQQEYAPASSRRVMAAVKSFYRFLRLEGLVAVDDAAAH